MCFKCAAHNLTSRWKIAISKCKYCGRSNTLLGESSVSLSDALSICCIYIHSEDQHLSSRIKLNLTWIQVTDFLLYLSLLASEKKFIWFIRRTGIYIVKIFAKSMTQLSYTKMAVHLLITFVIILSEHI